MAGHVEDDLAPYCEGVLTDAESRRVAAHLEECVACQSAEAELRRGLAWARSLEPAALAPEQAARIRQILAEAPAAPRAGRRAWRPLAAAAVLVAILVAADRWLPSRQQQPPPAPWTPPVGGLALVVDPGPPTRFEQKAFDLHAAHAEGRLALDLRSSSVPELKRWTEKTAGLGVSLAVERPPEDGDRFVPEGAAAVSVGDVKAVAVAYRVAGRPVTLLTAPAEAAPDRAPEWSSAGKHVRFRRVGRWKLLAWTNGGQTYALVSDLPAFGQQSCLLCHTTPGRRAAIRALRPSAPAPAGQQP